MIKKLQKKFIIITMASLLIVMFTLIGAINGMNLYQIDKRLNYTLELLTANQGRFPERGLPPKEMKPPLEGRMDVEDPFKTRYFSVEVNADGSIKQINTGHIAAVTSAQAQEYTFKVMNSGKMKGYEGIYKYAVVSQDEGYLVVFMDSRTQLMTAATFFINSLIVAAVTLILVFGLISILSKRAMKPFIENNEKQKRFITDAGHEIKTPLAIISANTDVLELSGGNNEWISSIRNQITRLDKLVKNLMTLSRLEEDYTRRMFSEFDISEAVAHMSEPFAAVASAAGKSFHMNIQQGIRFKGDESGIEQVVSTLIDNAIKYSNEDGNIKINLSVIKKGIMLEVSNSVNSLDYTNLDKLFDRFYRSENSRARETGGYGIGLSIAKSIVEAHHGRIKVRGLDENNICFTVLLISD
jgi:signal transduction histidine kinase